VSAGAELIAAGISIRDHFAGPPQIDALLECIEIRKSQGEFAPARIGSRGALQRRDDVRGDLTCWLSEPLHAAERSLLDRFEDLRLELNREAFLGLFDLELHYAWYPPGAAYSRHLDQPRGSAQRLLSVVLYLNRHWDAAAGGALRVYSADEHAVDIEPVAGRLACFLTPGREHEVLPANRDRYSISGWFRGRG
jgi:SM-20-related protein